MSVDRIASGRRPPAARAFGLAALRPLLPPAPGAVPLLVVRLPEIERTAWRHGRRQARSLERRAAQALRDASASVLRAGDVVAHDAGTDVFVAALAAPNRDGAGAGAVDVRSALARIVATLEGRLHIAVEGGWTMCGDDVASFDAVVEQALVRGARERERYAFFSAVGHELRTPLASIRGYLETLLDDSFDPQTGRRFLSIAHNETLRLSRLIEGMFEISLLDLQPAPARAVSGDLETALAAAADACAAHAAARAVDLRRGPVQHVRLAIDADRLTLVLVNLVDNAIKHGRSGGTVLLAARVDAAQCAITVDDDGPGVPPAWREKIFAFGARAQTRASGSGIGLALVRLLVERAGGRVDVARSPLGGARFTVLIPRA